MASLIPQTTAVVTTHAGHEANIASPAVVNDASASFWRGYTQGPEEHATHAHDRHTDQQQ